VLEWARPKEFAELAPLIDPRGMQVFFGAWDPGAPPVGLLGHVIRRLPANDAMPAGDFRDWATIDAWALEIANARSSAPRR
jgi:menaquinone-dependent protoporphyrinogen oxidase